MRNLLFSGKARRTEAAAAPQGPPDVLRRVTLAVNSRLTIVGAGLVMPMALYAAVHGLALPMVLAAIGLVTGFFTLMLHHRGAYDAAAAGQICGILCAGGLLAVADPAVVDFGLAVAVLAPIHASLLNGAWRKRVWGLLAVVFCLALASGAGLIAWPEPYQPAFRLVGGLTFGIVALIVAYTANRLNQAFEVYDRAQINAYRHLLEHVQDAVIRFSSEGELLFASRSSETLLGCKRYELSGNGLFERVHVLDRPVYLTAFADANQGGRARTVEIRMRHDDDGQARAAQFIWVEIALSPVVEGATLSSRHEVVALLRDVTDRRDQENEMRAARRAAEEASEAKSRFLATIGHELRTPLNAIVGFSEMMTSNIGGQLSAPHREYAELIHKSGTHLIGVVGMLLDMSRIEAGKFELSTESFSPEALVQPCLNMVDVLAREKQIRLVSQLTPNLPQIVADERACRQILINLLSNAIKFSHPSGVVTVAMKRQGDFLSLAVSDRGIGMSADAVSRIGEPFFQAQDGLSRRYEGTGLGLSIVKGLVDLHQGTLRVTSEPGSGTVMTVLLPINGPETKMPETSSVTPLRREGAAQPDVQWPEQKRSAK
ncbi:MAG: PAS domain-containing sensor histidine kinase [Devosia sp.]|nr:PAS domain-containing sensor histidine kinase [Devosia sp.]